MISLEDWALIRHLHRSEGLSQRAIARQLGIARDTVAGALASDGPPKYERASTPSAIGEVEPRMRALLSAYPQMPATVLAERVGWTGSISWFRERVRAIRPEYLPADPVDRLDHPPGRAIQCDLWFPASRIAVGFGQEADAAGVGDGRGVLPVHRCGDVALASDHGFGGRDVEATFGQLRCGAP